MVLVVKKPPANAEDIINAGLVPGLGRSPGEGHGCKIHSSIFSPRILWTEKPRGLQSLALQSVGHNWSELAQHMSEVINLPLTNKWLVQLKETEIILECGH